MMAITTSNSTSVNARRSFRLDSIAKLQKSGACILPHFGIKWDLIFANVNSIAFKSVLMVRLPRRHYKDLTLAQLRSFSVVCRTKSYAAAARELLLTSPAVWEQMQGLERHYGRPLLVRRGNGIVRRAE